MKKKRTLNQKLVLALHYSLIVLVVVIFLLVGTTIIHHIGEGGISCSGQEVRPCYQGERTDDLALLINNANYAQAGAFCNTMGYNLGYVNAGQGINVRCYTQVPDGIREHYYDVQVFVNWLKVQQATKNASEGL